MDAFLDLLPDNKEDNYENLGMKHGMALKKMLKRLREEEEKEENNITDIRNKFSKEN